MTKPTEISSQFIMAHGQGNAEIRKDGGGVTLTCNHEAPILMTMSEEWKCEKYGEENSAAWWPSCEWCDHEHKDVAFPISTMAAVSRHGDDRIGIGKDGDPSSTLSKAHSHAVATTYSVRRLTPRECERLQGFPDDYTLINGAKDGNRYKALGNSMAVNVMAWIGQRIQSVDDILREKP